LQLVKSVHVVIIELYMHIPSRRVKALLHCSQRPSIMLKETHSSIRDPDEIVPNSKSPCGLQRLGFDGKTE